MEGEAGRQKVGRVPHMRPLCQCARVYFRICRSVVPEWESMMRVRSVLTLAMLLASFDVRAKGRPASALHIENPRELELQQILERWRGGARLGERPSVCCFARA